MVSKKEGIVFLRRCGITDCESLLASDRYGLLCKIPLALQQNLPFQTLSMLSYKPSERKAFDWPTIKEHMLNFIGGTCLDLNTFTAELLKGLGFQSSLICGSCESKNVNHGLVLIEDVLTVGDKFIIDIGFGHPSFRAVSLDFERESEVFTDSVLTYKYIKEETGRYHRMHRQDSNTVRPFTKYTDDGWFYAFSFVIDKITFEELAAQLTVNVYRNPASPLMNSFRINAIVNGRFYAVRNFVTYEEVEAGKLTKVQGDANYVLEFVGKHFPALGSSMVKGALDNCFEYATH